MRISEIECFIILGLSDKDDTAYYKTTTIEEIAIEYIQELLQIEEITKVYVSRFLLDKEKALVFDRDSEIKI